MKRALIFAALVLVANVSFAADSAPSTNNKDVIHVATALDHLTVLEFGEPVILAAAGSSAFHIERQENKVFVKPLKAGAATDLFVWTQSRRFAYELESPGEPKNMNFAIDSPVPAPKRVPTVKNDDVQQVADMMLTEAFLGAQRISSDAIKDSNGRVTVRMEHLFRSRDNIYIHYSVRNLTPRPYRIQTPSLRRVLPIKSDISLVALEGTQLNQEMAGKLKKAKQVELPVASAATQKDDIGPGEQIQGIVAVRQQLNTPAVLELVFGNERDHPVKAVLVL